VVFWRHRNRYNQQWSVRDIVISPTLCIIKLQLNCLSVFARTSINMADPNTEFVELEERTADNVYVALTSHPLQISSTLDRVRSPSAGALVLFAGTTRDSFDNKPVQNLTYTSYTPLALRSMLSICQTLLQKYPITKIAMIHRLGEVPIGEESILIAVSSPHRQEAWRAGEEALELCKEKVEVWKLETFKEGGGVWRANRDGKAGVRVDGDGDTAQHNDDSAGERNKDENNIHVEAPTITAGNVWKHKNPLERGHGPVVHASGP
jgi:molybdopterin synthase catalytic subunit